MDRQKLSEAKQQIESKAPPLTEKDEVMALPDSPAGEAAGRRQVAPSGKKSRVSLDIST
jgi:hypothetical protein